MENDTVENRTVFCGNLCDQVTDEILFELFNQAGPVECVRRPRDTGSGRAKSFGFIVFKHECSVPYAVQLFNGTKLFNKLLNINTRSTARHVPVLDTHLTDFQQNTPLSHSQHRNHNRWRELSRSYNDDRNCRDRARGQKRSHDNRREHDSRDNSDRWEQRYEDSSRRKEFESEPSSWSALKGQGLASNGFNRSDLQSDSRSKSRDFVPDHGANNAPDFNALLQLGQQMMLPGMFPPAALPNMMPIMGMGMGLGPGIGVSPYMFPSMQGGYNGGRVSPDRHNQRRDHREDHRGWRDRPYDRQERRDGHYQGDRRYSSSRSSHDRESRDRRSR